MKTLALFAAGCAACLAAAAADSSAPAEFAASFEVRVDRIVDRAQMGFGFRLRKSAPFAEGNIDFSIPGPEASLGTRDLISGFDTAFRTGLWHHVAVAYREADNAARIFVDGDLMGVAHTLSAEPVGVKAFKKAPGKSGDFPGEIRNVRTWDEIPDDAELLPAATLGPIRAADFAFEASLVKGFDGKTPATGVLPVSIYRHAAEKHVPFKTPGDAAVLKELRVAAAQGEIEDASFLVLPFRDVKKFHVRVTDLKGDAGTIPAAAADMRIAKCWLQCRWGWTSFFGGGRQSPVLTPELLVHDDRLTYLDPKTHTQMLRLSYPEGERYVSVSTYGSKDTYPKFNYHLEPVHDAETLLPYDLETGRYSQLWLTFRIPEDAKGGLYRGSVVLAADGKDLQSVPLALTVHPFRLPRPGCHHEPDRVFMETWMGHYGLADKLTGSGEYTDGGYSLKNALKRQYAEFRNLAEHNSPYPWTTAFRDEDGTIDDWQLDIQKATGCEMKPLFGNVGVISMFSLWPKYPPAKEDWSVEGNLEIWTKEMVDFSNIVAKASARVEKKLGHREILYYAFDEAPPDCVRREFPFFATLNHFGGISFTTGGVDSESAFMTDFNDGSGGFNAEKSRRWHEPGSRIFSYASPHGGPECPDIWRRQKGLGAYFADLDGINEYIWYEGTHIWNEFLAPNEYKNFNMVYPTADGVLDTIQWEATREGLDDIRYFTLLMRVARAAMKAKDAKLAREGRLAVAWLETATEKDFWHCDLDALRIEAANRIVALNAALAKTGFDIASVTDRFPAPTENPVKVPVPDAAASVADLERDAAHYSTLGAADVAAAFHTAAAAKSKGEAAAQLYIKAAEESMRCRDLAAALKALDAGIALGKDAGGAFKALRVKRALVPCEVRGELKPDRKTVAAAAPVVRQYGTPGDSLKLIDAQLASGDFATAAKGYEEMFDRTGKYKAACAKGAGDAYAALGEAKRAAGWYGKAADLPGEHGHRMAMLGRAAEEAMKAKEYVFALNAYMNLLKCIDKKEAQSLYNAVKGQIGALSKITQKNSGGPAADPEASDDPISLDEEL